MDTDYIIPILIDHLKDRDSLSLPHYISSCLYVFSQVVLYSTANYESIQNHLDTIMELMASSDYLNSESIAVLESVLLLCTNVIKSVGSECLKYKRDLFKILLQLGSIPGTSHLHTEVETTIDLLALACGCKSTDELFSLELSSLIEELKESHENWDENTPERFIFDMLCRKSNEAVSQKWDDILLIVGTNCDSEKPSSLRMDMLSLIEHFLSKETLQDDLQYYGNVLVEGVFLPCIEWRSGMPNIKIRQAGIICTKKLIDNKLIKPSDLKFMLKNILGKVAN